MNAWTIIVAVLDVIACISLVVLVMMQEGNTKGLGVISGGADTFFGKSKGRSMDAMLKKMTSVVAVVFAVLTIVLYFLTGRGA